MQKDLREKKISANNNKNADETRTYKKCQNTHAKWLIFACDWFFSISLFLSCLSFGWSCFAAAAFADDGGEGSGGAPNTITMKRNNVRFQFKRNK